MYDHFIALDWAQLNMAIARLTPKSNKPHVIDVDSNITDLKIYLKNLKGKKILTFEETNTSQWLYTELRDFVDEIVVCDPRRNRLLLEGIKNDKNDALKLARLLRLGELKPVFHSGDEFLSLRKIVSGYEDVVKTYVMCANRSSAIYRSSGKKNNTDDLTEFSDKFVIEGLEKQKAQLMQERNRYESEFQKICKKNKLLRNLKTIPGVKDITAVKIAARIVDINRFPTLRHFWSYCGLIKFENLSGGRSYGKRKPRYCRSIKATICTSVISATNKGCNNPLKDRYEYLIQEKRYSDDQAKVAVRRLFAAVIFGVMKSNTRFDPRRFRKVNKS